MLKPARTTTVAFQVVGNPAPIYQWLSNSVAIPGANSLSVEVGPLAVNAKATYQLRASNSAGEVVSPGLAVVAVPENLPRITTAIVAGKVEVRSQDGLTFRWFLKSSPTLGPSAVWGLAANKVLTTQNQLLFSGPTNVAARYFRLELP